MSVIVSSGTRKGNGGRFHNPPPRHPSALRQGPSPARLGLPPMPAPQRTFNRYRISDRTRADLWLCLDCHGSETVWGQIAAAILCGAGLWESGWEVHHA